MVRCVFLVLFMVFVAATPVHAVIYQVPVQGVVIDPFRPPVNPYGPGNRGWEFRVDLDTEVRAPADGTVTFAGQVGGTLNVVIEHDDGVRTTLRKLTVIDVHKGDAVQAGQRIGTASGEFYFGARCGSTYIDPRKLFDRRVWLVPLDGEIEEQPSPFSCDVQTSLRDNRRGSQLRL